MQKPSSIDIPLHDIKPLVEVPDSSLYMVILIAALIVVAFIVLVLVVRYFLAKKKTNIRIAQFKALESIDFSNAKESAYLISQYGLAFRDDSERHFEAYENLSNRLSQYKYKKEVDSTIDDETKGYFDIYLGMIDV